VVTQGAISVAGWAVLIAGIAAFSIWRALAGRRRAEQALHAATYRTEALLRDQASQQTQTDRRLHEQLLRFALLDRITRAIGERQDTSSLYQAVAVTLEGGMPVQWACICLHEAAAHVFVVASIGPRSAALAEPPFAQGARLEIEQNDLSRCARGQLAYEPDLGAGSSALFDRLLAAGLRSLVAVPLQLEAKVLGVVMVARNRAQGFSSSDCEFLRQLSDHVALAAHQAQLHGSLQLAYDDLRRTQQQVMDQERLRALGEMASGAAHNINNAISPILLYTDTLLDTEPELSSRARDYLQTIRRSIGEVALMVTRMREFHGPREAQPALAAVNLNELARQAADLTRARWSDMPLQGGAVVRMRMELEDDLPAVGGVAGEIREALINLIFNAVDAMPTGGTLTLRTRHSPAAEGEEACVSIEVADSGVGMDEETRRRCLEPFFTTKGERGSGLGLSMVYGVAEHSDARLEIESALGVGTTVRLAFAALSAAPAPVAAARVPQAQLRILIVDDDPTLLRSLRDALEGDGHTIMTAAGGREGIETFRAAVDSEQPFAVVITDLGMPYVDGRQVAAAVKEASSSTRVVMLTGWGQRLASRGEVPPHVDRLLSKPPRLRDLREALA
jgi:signal transduction histidine kinase